MLLNAFTVFRLYSVVESGRSYGKGLIMVQSDNGVWSVTLVCGRATIVGKGERPAFTPSGPDALLAISNDGMFLADASTQMQQWLSIYVLDNGKWARSHFQSLPKYASEIRFDNEGVLPDLLLTVYDGEERLCFMGKEWVIAHKRK